MEEALVALLQFLFEFLLEVLSYSSFGWPTRRSERPGPETIVGVCMLWFVGGCGLAWLSVLLLKHTLIHHSWLRITNLILAPPTSAYISQAFARKRAKRDPFVEPWNQFWQSFWFTLGLVSVRFAYAVR
jgi:hypothetical protein